MPPFGSAVKKLALSVLFPVALCVAFGNALLSFFMGLNSPLAQCSLRKCGLSSVCVLCGCVPAHVVYHRVWGFVKCHCALLPLCLAGRGLLCAPTPSFGIVFLWLLAGEPFGYVSFVVTLILGAAFKSTFPSHRPLLPLTVAPSWVMFGSHFVLGYSP